MVADFAVEFSQIAEPNAAPIWLAYNPNNADVYTQAVASGLGGFEETANFARRFFRQAAPANRSFVDVGANIGVFAFGVAALGVPVTAIEAIPETFLLLSAGIEKNRLRNVRAIHAAATSESGLCHVSGSSHWAKITDNGIMVPGLTLDHILATSDLPPPALVKMDVEGFEYDVLRGAQKLIENTPDVDFIVEVHPGNERTLEFLEQTGFNCYMIRLGLLIEAKSSDFQESLNADYYCTRRKLSGPAHYAGTPVSPRAAEVSMHILAGEVNASAPRHRALTAGRLRDAPEHLRAHPAMSVFIEQLKNDPDESVRNAINA